jgi:hypothetical protein
VIVSVNVTHVNALIVSVKGGQMSDIRQVSAVPIIYQTERFTVDGMRVLFPEPMEVGENVKSKTFNPEPKGGSKRKARGGGAATKGLKFEGVL